MIRILALLGSLLVALSVQAAQIGPIPPIAALNQGLLGIMQAGKATPFEQRYATMVPIVHQTFDLDTILETSVGPRWSSFSQAEQQDLRAEFLRFTVASYVSNFSSFDGQKFTIEPDTRSVGAEQVVATHIIPTRGDPARLDYVMRQGDDGWHAVDVLLDGSISRVAVQRSDFRSLLAGGPAALVASLHKKVLDLSGGALVP